MEKPKDVEIIAPESRPAQLFSTEYARWYKVPDKHVVSIENPFIIKDIEKGIETMGGVNKLQEVTKIRHGHFNDVSDGTCSWSGIAMKQSQTST